MTLEQLFHSILKVYWDLFQYDLSVFSQGWIYYWLLIPVTFYTIFFISKWVIILFPIWVIPVMILKSMDRIVNRDRQLQVKHWKDKDDYHV